MISTKRILFVDDDINVLHGLRRMLRDMRGVWEMVFAEDAIKALEIIEEMQIDVIISDMRMPNMDGAEFFARVRDDHPEIARIILSGQSDREMIMRTVGGAHQYLSKPCNAEHLRDAISRTCALREALTNEMLLNKVSGLTAVPSSPILYNELKQSLCSSDVTTETVVGLITRDPGMTAKVLQLVNSDFFCYGQRVSDVREAVKLLGLDLIRSLVLSIDVFFGSDLSVLTSVPSSPNETNAFIEHLWRHSLRTAVLAQQISYAETKSREFADDTFAAGLLHDVGVAVLCANDANYIQACIGCESITRMPLWRIEQNVMSITHAELGAYLLGLWGLPDVVVEGVLYHHNPEKSPSKCFSPVTVVHVANCFEHLQSNSQNNKPYSRSPLLDIDYEYLEQVGCLSKLLDWKVLCSITDSEGLIDKFVK